MSNKGSYKNQQLVVSHEKIQQHVKYVAMKKCLEIVILNQNIIILKILIKHLFIILPHKYRYSYYSFIGFTIVLDKKPQKFNVDRPSDK